MLAPWAGIRLTPPSSSASSTRSFACWRPLGRGRRLAGGPGRHRRRAGLGRRRSVAHGRAAGARGHLAGAAAGERARGARAGRGAPAWTDGALAVPVPDVGVLAAVGPPPATAPIPSCWPPCASLGARRSPSSPSAAGRTRRPRARRAQERDPQRRVRLHHHHGPRGARASRSTRPPSGRSATPSRRWSATSWPALIIPPGLREQHRHGLERFMESGRADGAGTARRAHGDARGRQRVPRRADRHPAGAARAAAVLRLPARRDRAPRGPSARCASWPRSRRRCAAWPRPWPRRPSRRRLRRW